MMKLENKCGQNCWRLTFLTFPLNQVILTILQLQVNAVREVMPGKSNNEIILVLQYYDYNVEKAIQAYVEGMLCIGV